MSASVSERFRVLELVVRHGWNATAFQTLEVGYRYFFHGADACVAYVDTGSAWVAAGAPIAKATELEQVVRAFVHAARQAGKRCCFFATEERLRSGAGEALRSLAIGEQPNWDPRHWPEILAQHRSLREQLRRARAKGVQIRLLDSAELARGKTHDQLARIAERWLNARSMAPMGFLVRLEPFSFPSARRCFVAEIDGRALAFAGVIPVPRRDGWFLEDLARDPSAPNGASELLVDAVMRWASAEGSSFLTFGLTPLSGSLPRWLRLVRRSTTFLYDFEGLRAYKSKFRPLDWSPIFLSYPTGQSLLASVADALAAFTQGGFVRFGWRSLRRGPRVVLRARARPRAASPSPRRAEPQPPAREPAR